MRLQGFPQQYPRPHRAIQRSEGTSALLHLLRVCSIRVQCIAGSLALDPSVQPRKDSVGINLALGAAGNF